MAAIKYQCEFYSNNGTRYRINIYHVSYSGTIVPFKGGMDGFKLKYEGTNDSEFKPVKASVLEFDFLIEELPTSSGDPTTGNIYNDLIENNESTLFVILEHYDGTDAVWIKSWAGDIIDDTVTIADEPMPTRIRIRATDGVAKMKQKIYEPVSGANWNPVLYYFQKAIEVTTCYSTMWPSSDGTSAIPLRNTVNRYNVNMGDVTDSTWKDTYNPYKLAFINEAAFKKDNGIFMTYYEILEQIATLYGVQFFQSWKYAENQGGSWWLFSRYVMWNEPLETIPSSCRIFDNQAYDSGGNALTSYEYAVPNTSTLSNTLNVRQNLGLDLNANRPKLKGNKISYVPSLGIVQNNYYHDLISYPLNMNDANATQYSNATVQAIGGGGFIGWYGESAVTSTQLDSPMFPTGMSYSGSDTTYGANNNGWFIPLTSGQDVMCITGEATFNYNFSWTAGTVFDAFLGAFQVASSFVLPLRAVVVISNKSSSDYAQAQNDGNNLNDIEIRRWLDGSFGDGSATVSEWSSSITDFDSPTSPQLRVKLNAPPLVNGETQSITVPFSFITEPIPDVFGSGQDYLKRFQFSIANYEDDRMVEGALLNSLTSGSSGFTLNTFAIQVNNLKTSLIFDGSQISNYFGSEHGKYVNTNTDASTQITIKPDFFIGDPPFWIAEGAGGPSEANLAPTQYFGGIRIHSPSAVDPTTTFPNQIQTNEADWRTEHDSSEKPIHKLLCREIIKKRCFPVFKYNIKVQCLNTAANVHFWNTFKINMRLNDGADDDIHGFFPIGGTYTAMTNTWNFTLQQMDINTETNLNDASFNEYNDEPFMNNPNFFIQFNS